LSAEFAAIDAVLERSRRGPLLVSGWFRSRRKIASHQFCLNVGLKMIPRERRRSRSKMMRLLAALDAMSAAGQAGMKEIVRLTQAREQMQRRLRSRRSSSSLPGVTDLVLSRPIVSAAMIAKEVKVTPRGALNLIAELWRSGDDGQGTVSRMGNSLKTCANGFR
jgi:hypothetical protein